MGAQGVLLEGGVLEGGGGGIGRREEGAAVCARDLRDQTVGGWKNNGGEVLTTTVAWRTTVKPLGQLK